MPSTESGEREAVAVSSSPVLRTGLSLTISLSRFSLSEYVWISRLDVLDFQTGGSGFPDWCLSRFPDWLPVWISRLDSVGVTQSCGCFFVHSSADRTWY